MKKILCSLFIILFLLPLFTTRIKADESQTIYQSNISSFGASSAYSGKKVTSHIKVSDFVSLNIKSSGGEHVDGNGKKVYSNYVEAQFNFKVDSNHNIVGTDTKIIKDTRFKIDKSWFESSEDYELDSQNFGLMIVSKENGQGNQELENPVYLDNVNCSTTTLYFNEDANYHVRFFIKTKNGNGDKQKTVIEFTIPIRTSIFLKDTSGLFDVKDNGFYYNAIKIDDAGRKNVSITVDGKKYESGREIRNKGVYNFVVEANGFVCEEFSFEIYDYLNRVYPVFSNLRKEIGHKIYEAENNFSVAFQQLDGWTYTYSYNYGEQISFTSNKQFTEPGYYELTFEHKASKYSVKYMIFLSENDNPEYNYNILSQKRFNNFKTKWIEVYDEVNENYNCFDFSEYSLAMSCALSIERDKIIDNGYGFEYNNKFYNRISDLTKELNANAEKLLNIKYYDINDEQIVKRFSNILFDDSIYLNPDFAFIKVHHSETNKVELIDENNVVTKVDFATPISNYNLSSGKYKVVESDSYNNKTEYSVFIDNEKPELVINSDEGSIECEENKTYNVRYFSVEELIDDYDDYAVLKVNNDYYLKNEIKNAVYSETGSYNILVYDRNNNSSSFNINVVSDKLYNVFEDEKMYTVNLSENTSITLVLINGIEQKDLNSLNIEKKNEDLEYLIYLENGDEKDLIRIKMVKDDSVEIDQNIDDADDSGNDETPFVMSWQFIVTIVIVAVTLITGIILIVYRKETENDKSI